MFKKLIKYDLKAVAKLWWIGVLVSVAAAVIGALLMRFSIYTTENPTDPFTSVLGSFAMIASIFCILAIELAFLFTVILVFVRFYKNFFTDEGYLTFTLPVKRSTLFLAKTVNASIWLTAHFAVTVASLALFALFVMPAENNGGIINPIIFTTIGEVLGEIWSAIGPWSIVFSAEALLILFISMLFTVSLIHFCISFGSVVVKKAKLILSLGIYYLISTAIASIGQFALFLFAGLGVAGLETLTEGVPLDQVCAAITFLLLGIAAALATVALVLYSVTQYLLDRKLNLA